MKLLAIVIAYNPVISDLRDNIESYINEVDWLIIWNNTPGQDNLHLVMELSLSDIVRNKVQFFGGDGNKLIAYPLNQAIEWGVKHNYTHLLTMDQDSRFEQGAMAMYKKICEQYPSHVIGVNPNGKHCSTNVCEQVLSVITSGTIYKMDIFGKIGNFREDYGIDAVDIEICFRAREYGYNIMEAIPVVMNHSFGDPIIIAGKYETPNYSPFRRYQFLRNHIWMKKEYPTLFEESFNNFYLDHVVKSIVKIIIAETDKINKISATIRGLKDGLLYAKNQIK